MVSKDLGKMSTVTGGIELMNKMMVDLRNVLVPKTTVITHFRCAGLHRRRLLVKKEEEEEPLSSNGSESKKE